MREEAAAMRPMVVLEREQHSLCSCERGEAAYVARCLRTDYKSKRYNLAGAKRYPKFWRYERLCRTCAEQWAKENGLTLRDSPIPDPSPGQRWVRVGSPGFVVRVIGWAVRGCTKQIRFDPPLPNTRIDGLHPRQFLEMFDPVFEDGLAEDGDAAPAKQATIEQRLAQRCRHIDHDGKHEGEKS